MTTAVESLEALHLWLATELPELRRYSRKASHFNSEGSPQYWVPNVETDALLEALRAQGWPLGNWAMSESHSTVSVDDGDRQRHGQAPTFHEALCRAARKALEAS